MRDKVVVIGGSGFLGSYVAEKLSKRNYDTIIYDQKEPIKLLKNQIFIKGDIKDAKKLIHTVKETKYVYNFAALADLDAAQTQPLSTVEINVLGNVNVLEACRLSKVERYVFASSIYVFSKEGGFYRCSKQSAETYIEEYNNQYNLDYTILRYGSLYGKGADSSNNIYKIIKKALKTKTLIYEGNIEAIREYIHVEDAANASIDCLTNEYKNQSLVLTGLESIKVKDFLFMLAEILNIPFENVEFRNNYFTGHYVRTPYSFQPKLGRKYIPKDHIDFGQGLLELIENIDREIKEEKQDNTSNNVAI